jgi:hypothetical protein
MMMVVMHHHRWCGRGCRIVGVQIEDVNEAVEGRRCCAGSHMGVVTALLWLLLLLLESILASRGV